MLSKILFVCSAAYMSAPVRSDLTLPVPTGISEQFDNRPAIADMSNSWKDLLDILPVYHILPVDIIDIDVFDTGCCACNGK
jgi:hypothetical protein